MAKRAHVAGIFVSCMSSVPRAFVRMPNSRAALTIYAKLFTFTRVKRVHARVHTHVCVKFKVSGTVATVQLKGNLGRTHVFCSRVICACMCLHGIHARQRITITGNDEGSSPPSLVLCTVCLGTREISVCL